jgi:hypothetical protein
MNLTNITLELVLRESFFGLSVMFAVVIFNIYSFSWVSSAYQQVLDRSVFRNVHIEMLRLSLFVMLLVAVMLFSLSIWVVALGLSGLIPDWPTALVFTASYFTSVGNFDMSFPYGWRLIPSIVAFSGFFSFAWATAVSIGMSRYHREFIDKQC